MCRIHGTGGAYGIFTTHNSSTLQYEHVRLTNSGCCFVELLSLLCRLVWFLPLSAFIIIHRLPTWRFLFRSGTTAMAARARLWRHGPSPRPRTSSHWYVPKSGCALPSLRAIVLSVIDPHAMQRLAVGVSGSILVALVLVGAVAAAASSAAAPGPADATPCRDVVALRDRSGVYPGVATLLTMHCRRH